VTGEVFDLAYGINDRKLLSLGYIVPVEQDDHIYEHGPTGRLFITANYRDNFERNQQQMQMSGESAAVVAPISASEAAPRPAPGPTQRRQRSRKYSNRDRFVEVLGRIIDALRLQIGHRDPTLEEIAYASDKNTDALWPEGMSPTTLKTRLKEHEINLATFCAKRPWPSRHLP
jgi:hypothetical protein